MVSTRKNNTREKIKDVAQQLIAEHGVDGISIRDIIIAAGQRNMASLWSWMSGVGAVTGSRLLREPVTTTSVSASVDEF